MKSSFFLFLALVLAVFPVYSVEWKILETGLSYKKIEIEKHSRGYPYVVHAFKIDPGKFYFRPLTSTPEPFSSIRSLAEKSGALVAVNANFFDLSGKPLGLIISHGKVLNPLRDISWWGVFYVEKEIPHIVHSRQFKQTSQISTALQAGPRLLVDGKVPRLKAETSPKTAIGLTGNGEVVVLTTLFPFEIGELARLMALSEEKGGLSCVAALNFDGGSSSQMYAHIGSFELRLPSYVGVPVGLGVFRK